MCYYFTARHHKKDKKRFCRNQFTVAVCIIISYMGSTNKMFICMGFRTTNIAFSRSILKRHSHHRYCAYNHQKSKANHNDSIARYLSSKTKTNNNNKSDDYRDHTTTAPTSAKGVTHSSSDFVTHFIAGPDNTLTTLQAIGKVMNNKSASLPSMEEQDNDEIISSKERRNDKMNKDNGGEVVAVAVDRDNFNLTPSQLLALGSVWFLPADAPRDPSLGGKPKRLTIKDATRILDEGDYLRVHHTPRRFPAVYDFSWNREAKDGDANPIDEKNDMSTISSYGSDNIKPSVIVASDSEKGYIVINKPAGVPVHCTVDNALENVADCLRTSLTKEITKKKDKKNENDNDNITTIHTPATKTKRKRSQKGKAKDSDSGVYVSTPQRLDQNTSGLLVVATRKVFASYYAKILRHKTGKQLVVSSPENNDDNNNDTSRQGGIHKEYRCLVCINEPQNKDEGNGIEQEMEDPSSPPPSSWSVLGALETLKNYASDQTIIRHYLEPSIRAPKNFERIPGNESWAESLLRIKNVGDLYPLVGSKANDDLANSLWVHPEAVPKECKAIVELEIELLTGRTHQIRGQLSTEGFPLVGDAQYGGAIPLSTTVTTTALDKDDDNEATKSQSLPYGYVRFDKLALQCSQLEFLDPDIVLKDDGTEVGRISDRWNVFRLEDAWWTPHLTDHQQQMEASTDASDEELVRALKDASTSPMAIENDSAAIITPPLPPNILLAPGVHKYVLLKAMKYSSSTEDDGSKTEVQWFVKSASPVECGGPYHANVAQSLVSELQCKGYDVTITGGGRIDYNNDEHAPHAHVYGFSYGFGKGDHAKAASLIESYSNNTVIATFDNSNTLY